jgi:tetratricopeptide (TPR) repeat protein
MKEANVLQPIQKRRIALLISMNKIQEAISMLGDLLVISPTDAEAWAELSDLYFEQNLYDQAIFCLEEVLLVMPNAWNVSRSSLSVPQMLSKPQMHARLAEVIYLSTIAMASDKPGDVLRGLAESMRRYCRSVELCNDYLRGYYGLKLVSRFPCY